MRSVLITLSILCALKYTSGVEERYDVRQAYCFQFTWLGLKPDDSTDTRVNCSSWGAQPCIKPFIYTNTSSYPDVKYMWDSANRTEFSCSMRPGYACIKYSYIFNDAVIRASYFCGKMIENRKRAINDGCYIQKLSGHIIEACACKSDSGDIPCNFSAALTSSLFIVIFVLSVSLINFCL